MPTLQQHLTAPQNIEEARLIVDWLSSNPTKHSEVVLSSLRIWDQQGCHLLAQELKGAPQFGHGHFLATNLRQVANAAIVQEHRLANRPR
jgi:hypothetical protein